MKTDIEKTNKWWSDRMQDLRDSHKLKVNYKDLKIDIRSEVSLYIKFPNGKTYYFECSEATENKLYKSKV